MIDIEITGKTQQGEQPFESIKHRGENGEEYWLARELMPVLEYDRWENFYNAIARASSACRNSGVDEAEHFREVTKLTNTAHGGARRIVDFALSRYACYLRTLRRLADGLGMNVSIQFQPRA